MRRAILLTNKKSLYEGETILLIERRTIIIVDGMVTDEIMFYFFLLPWGRGSGAYRYLFVDLTGVSIDDGRGEMLGYLTGEERCLAIVKAASLLPTPVGPRSTNSVFNVD